MAGVAPKPPVIHSEKHESPSVKGVPLHSDHPSIVENHKPAEAKHEVKPVEAVKPQEKSAKKDEHQQPAVKKADQHGHHEAAKHEVPQGSHAKVVQEHQPAHLAKDAHKDQKVEVVKANHGH